MHVLHAQQPAQAAVRLLPLIHTPLRGRRGRGLSATDQSAAGALSLPPLVLIGLTGTRSPARCRGCTLSASCSLPRVERGLLHRGEQ
eukprot:2176402-Lingulodinium_polyedra.AAC.1